MKKKKKTDKPFQLEIFMGFVWITKAQTTFDRTPGSFQGTGHRYEY